jgi:RNA polymerase sigma factor (sigma-70 family)
VRSLIDHLYRKYARELLVFADRRVGSAAAPDIVQEAYLRLLQHSGTGAILNPRAYLYRVVGQIAGAFAQLERHADIDPDARPDDLHAPDPSADDIADSASRLRLRLAALDELPKLQRHAFLLHRIDG